MLSNPLGDTLMTSIHEIARPQLSGHAFTHYRRRP